MFICGDGEIRTPVHINFTDESTRFIFSFGFTIDAFRKAEHIYSYPKFQIGDGNAPILSSEYYTRVSPRESEEVGWPKASASYARAVAKAKSFAPKYGETTFRAFALEVPRSFTRF